jgi:membrane-bound acyltransferase YfiQ involved in biofilm formation
MFKRLLLLNGLATLGVVLYHASSWGFIAMFWWTDRYLPVTVPNFDQLGGLSYYALRVIEQLIVFSIPAFLFVSGFFIAVVTGRSRRTVEWELVGARIKNLVIPYLIWTALIFAGELLQGRTHTGMEYLKGFLLGQATPAFYYVPLLSQMYLLSPFLVPIAKTRWRWLLLGAGLLQLAAQGLIYPDILGAESPALQSVTAVLTRGWFFPGRVFWFAFGLVAGFHLQQLKRWLAQVKWAVLGFLIVSILLGMLETEVLLAASGQEWIAPRETVIDSLCAGCFLLCFLAFEEVSLPFSKALGKIGGKSFGVYLAHSTALELGARVTFHVAPWIMASQVLFQPMLVTLGLGGPLLLMAAVKRSPVHRVYHYLFG